MRKLLLSFAAAALALSASSQTVYFEEDFEWLEPWTTATKVHDWVQDCDTVAAESKNLANKAEEGGQTAYEALLEKGYTFVQATHSSKSERTADKVMYLQKNYLNSVLPDIMQVLFFPL